MNDSGQRHARDADTESQRETTPRLMVGSWAGEAAVVEARTGRVCWLRRTGRELGTLAINEDAAYLATGITYAGMKRLSSARDLDPDRRQRLIAQVNIPSQLEARRASDGALLWTYTHPKITGRLHVEAENGMVVAANPRHFEADVPPIQVFDGMTGDLLWQIDGKNAQWSTDRLVAVRGGHIYARLGEHLDEAATALDLHTGEPLWQHTWHNPWIFSPNGTLIAEQPPMSNMMLIDARDGAELSNIPLRGMLHRLTDDGIAYTSMLDAPNDIWLAALDARSGKQVWRVAGLGADSIALDGHILCYVHTLPEQCIAEVGALDAATGERLWQWRSPGSLGELLRLWGPHRMPAMLWDSTEKSVATVREIVWKPWFRLRRPRWPARIPQRRQSPTMKLRGIRDAIASEVVWPLWREFSQGHWRHPWQTHDATNANWLAARWGIVFLGTWLGLFALDAATGRLLWHALPTIDLSFVDPALAP